MHDFLNFNKMLTPTIIKVIFLVGSVLSVIGGLFAMVAGTQQPYGGGAAVFMGLLMILFGPFVTRVYCELLIVQFKMHEALDKLAKQNES